MFFFFFKQKTAYEIYQCDWSSDVCSSDLLPSQARNGQREDGAGIAKRLIEISHQRLDLLQRRYVKRQQRVLHAQRVCRARRDGRFVERRVTCADRKCTKRCPGVPRSLVGDDGRIDAAGQENAVRDRKSVV